MCIRDSTGPRRIAYLCSQVTIPGSPTRRVDAFEHDLMMDAMRAAFVDRNLDVRELCWDDEATDWSTYDAVIIGTTWDYWDRRDEYVQTLAKIGDATHLWNPIETVRWNIDKRYLRDLEAKGAPMIPTLWLDDPSETAITEAFDHFKDDDLVIKRQIGASSDGQHRIRRGDPIPGFTLSLIHI